MVAFRNTLFALILAVTTAVSSLGFGGMTREVLIQSTLKSIIRVEFATESGETGVCTGFVVKPGVAITAKHCTPDGDDLIVDGNEGYSVMASTDTISAIEVPRVIPALELHRGLVMPGEPVLSFGYGWGWMKVLARNIAGFDAQDDVVIDGGLVPGMSGGPIVDYDGRVIAINQASDGVTGLGCGVGEIRDFLNNLPK